MKPNSIEDLIEMHEKLYSLEDRGEGLDKVLNSAIKEKQEFQNKLMIIKTDSVVYSDIIKRQMKDLRDGIGFFIKLKSDLKWFIDTKTLVYEEFEINETLALKSNTYQYTIKQSVSLVTTLMALENLITLQTNVLEKQQKIILDDIKPMVLIGEMIKLFN